MKLNSTIIAFILVIGVSSPLMAGPHGDKDRHDSRHQEEESDSHGRHHTQDDDHGHRSRDRHHSEDDDSHHHSRGEHRSDDNIHISINISLGERTIIENYLRENHHRHCPPGLAKKHNGCIPPGIAKKYAVGRPLPTGIEYQRLPDYLLRELHPHPGYQYVKVDRDVLLISEATKKVVDAITLLSAVGQ